ncbi:MAG: S9 family peptidase [Chloroflexi bacterium]|nr:S9 family peptidase [Chloroflexota bacterium]
MEEHNGLCSMPLPHAQTPEGLWPELIVSGWERVHNHAVSPDGTHVAYYRDRNGHTDLWVTGINQPHFPERLTFNRPFANWWEDEPPVWSPDGEWLVYGAYRDEVSNLYTVSVNGSVPRALTDLSEDVAEPCFSPDGRVIVFNTYKDGASQIATIPFEGGWISGLTQGSEECSGASWSGDGTRIIYHASSQDGRRHTDVYAVAPGGGPPMRLTPADGAEYWSASFSPDGSCIALLSNRSGFDELWLMGADGSHLRQCSFLRQDIEEYAWSSDGGCIVLVASEHGNDSLCVLNVGTSMLKRVPTPAGNFTSPRWVCGQNAVVVGYDSPKSPPDLYLCELETGRMTPLASSNAPALRHYPFVMPAFVEYTSFDGWQIPAFVYWPSRPAPDVRGYPALVYPHGGPTSEYDLHWDPVLQYFAAKGYVVICPNYRGSTGYGRQFKEGNLINWGMGDLNDCLFAANYIGGKPSVDQHRIGVWGQSYGGYLALLALSKDPSYRFRCGVSLYGDSHLKTSWALGDHSGRQDLEWQMGTPALRGRAYEESSPLNFSENIRAPLLVIHGERDPRVHLNESSQLIEALRRGGKTYEYKTYPDEGHGFSKPENALDALERIERFLDWYLL